MSTYKDEKTQFDEMLINIATGSVDPKALNGTLQALRKTGNFLFETVEKLEGEKVGLEALLETEKATHETLKTKYHEKWENEGGSDEHENEDIKPDVKLNTNEVLEELERLSQNDSEVK